jgi:anti-sigma B factor antagonist
MSTADADFTVGKAEGVTVVEFTTPSLMHAGDLDRIAEALYRLVEADGRRRVVLDFGRVQYLSSRAIGIVTGLRKRLAAFPGSRLVLCGVGPSLMQLLKIAGLDRLLTIKPSRREAIRM